MEQAKAYHSKLVSLKKEMSALMDKSSKLKVKKFNRTNGRSLPVFDIESTLIFGKRIFYWLVKWGYFDYVVMEEKRNQVGKSSFSWAFLLTNAIKIFILPWPLATQDWHVLLQLYSDFMCTVPTYTYSCSLRYIYADNLKTLNNNRFNLMYM